MNRLAQLLMGRGPASEELPESNMFQDTIKTKYQYLDEEGKKAKSARDAALEEIRKKAGINVALTPPQFQKEMQKRFLGVQDMVGRDASLAKLAEAIKGYEEAPMREDNRAAVGFLGQLAGMPGAEKMLSPVESLEERKATLSKLQSLLSAETGDDVRSFIDFAKQQQLEQMIDPTKGIPSEPTHIIIEKTKMEGARPLSGKGGKLDTRELSKRLEYTPRIINLGTELLSFVKKYEGKDIPGIGPIDAIKAQTIGGPGADMFQKAVDLYRAKVYMESGKQINEKEAQDQMKTLGISRFSTDKNFKSGLQNLIENTIATAKQIEGGYEPEVVDEFKRRGGIGYNEILKAYEGVNSTPSGPVKRGPKKPIDQMTKEELKEYLGEK